MKGDGPAYFASEKIVRMFSLDAIGITLFFERPIEIVDGSFNASIGMLDANRMMCGVVAGVRHTAVGIDLLDDPSCTVGSIACGIITVCD